jgi:hypothetical protein
MGLIDSDTAGGGGGQDGKTCSCRARWQVPIQHNARKRCAQGDERAGRKGRSKANKEEEKNTGLERTSRERRRVCEDECVLD